jgi:hypothetical protein
MIETLKNSSKPSGYGGARTAALVTVPEARSATDTRPVRLSQTVRSDQRSSETAFLRPVIMPFTRFSRVSRLTTSTSRYPPWLGCSSPRYLRTPRPKQSALLHALARLFCLCLDVKCATKPPVGILVFSRYLKTLVIMCLRRPGLNLA